MKKPVVAVDLDDVLVPQAGAVLDYYNRTYGTDLRLKDYGSKNLSFWKVKTAEEAVRRVQLYLQSEDYHALTPFPEALASLKLLKSKYQLVVITARSDAIRQATADWLERHFPKIFDKVYFQNYWHHKEGLVKPKWQFCRDIGASVLIDDNLATAMECAEAGIKVLLFGDYPWNQAGDLPKDVKRVNNWGEVLERLLQEG